MTRPGPSVTRSLVRLKVRLLRNRARSSRGGRWRLLAGALTSAVLAVLAFAAASAAGHSDDATVVRASAVVGATGLAIAWAVLPLITFGSDESLDPSRLATFPLRRGSLMRGLLVASLVGFAPAVAEVAVIGALAGQSGRAGAVGLVIGAAAMVLLVVFCAAGGRTLSTLLAAGLTSRRGRDATIVLVSVLLLSAQGLRFIRFSAIDPAVFDHLSNLLRWLPPGMLGQALVDARHGRHFLALAELVPPAAAVLALTAVWARALDRSLTVVNGDTGNRRRRRPVELPLMPRRLGFVAPVPWGAVAAKELRYAVRDPRRKVTLINSVLVGSILPLGVALRSSGSARSGSVLLATLAGYIVVLGAMNQFGSDGAALWLDVVAGDRVHEELIGKNLALLILVLPIVTGVGAVVAAVSNGWLFLPATCLLAIAGLGAGLGIANMASVRFPIRLPDTRSPFGGYGGGQGCATTAMVLGCSLAQNLVIAPVVVAAAVTTAVAPVALVVVAPVCAAYGAGLWWIGLTIATRWARGHQPEMVRALDPARSD